MTPSHLQPTPEPLLRSPSPTRVPALPHLPDPQLPPGRAALEALQRDLSLREAKKIGPMTAGFCQTPRAQPRCNFGLKETSHLEEALRVLLMGTREVCDELRNC